MFLARNDTEAESPVLWPPHVKSWLIGKDSDAGRDRGQDKKGTTEDEMAGWQHQLDGYEFGWTLGVGFGQGGLACCNSWGHKESETTERLNWTESHNLIHFKYFFLIKVPSDIFTAKYSKFIYNLIISDFCSAFGSANYFLFLKDFFPGFYYFTFLTPLFLIIIYLFLNLLLIIP